MAQFYTLNESNYFTTSGMRTEEFEYTTLSYTASRTVEDTEIVDTDTFSVQTNTTVPNDIYQTTSTLNINPSTYELLEDLKATRQTVSQSLGPTAYGYLVSNKYTLPENVSFSFHRNIYKTVNGNKVTAYFGTGVTGGEQVSWPTITINKSFYSTLGSGFSWDALTPYVDTKTHTRFPYLVNESTAYYSLRYAYNGNEVLSVDSTTHEFSFNGYSYRDGERTFMDTVSSRNTTTSIQSESTSYRTSTHTDTLYESGKMEPHYFVISNTNDNLMTGYYLTTDNEVGDNIRVTRSDLIVYVGSSYTVDSATKSITETYYETYMPTTILTVSYEERIGFITHYVSTATGTWTRSVPNVSGGPSGSYWTSARVSVPVARITGSWGEPIFNNQSDTQYISITKDMIVSYYSNVAFGSASISTLTYYPPATANAKSSGVIFPATKDELINEGDGAKVNYVSFCKGTGATAGYTSYGIDGFKGYDYISYTAGAQISSVGVYASALITNHNKHFDLMYTIEPKVRVANNLSSYQDFVFLKNTVTNMESSGKATWANNLNGSNVLLLKYMTSMLAQSVNYYHITSYSSATRSKTIIDYVNQGSISTNAVLANEFYLAKRRDTNTQRMSVFTEPIIVRFTQQNSHLALDYNSAVQGVWLNGAQTNVINEPLNDMYIKVAGNQILVANTNVTNGVLDVSENYDPYTGHYTKTFSISTTYTY